MARSHIRLADTSLSEAWVDAQVKAITTIINRPVDGSNFSEIVTALKSLKEYLERLREDVSTISGHHPYFQPELRVFEGPITIVESVIRDYKQLEDRLNKRVESPLWTFTEESIRRQYKKDVKILGDAFRYTPSLSFKLDTLLADVASKIPPEIDDTTYNPQLIAWLKAKKVKDRIFRIALHRGEYKIDYIKFLLNWFNDLRSNPRTDEGYQNKGAYREVSMGRANIVIIDPAGDKDYDAQFVKAASRLHHQLQRSKLDAVWYGPLFYMGTKNPELTGELLTLAKNMGYDISSYAGRYNPGTDLVLTSGYAEDAAKTLAHELGHRYWYKFMDKEHRGRFQDLVRTRPPAIENTSEAQKKYLDEMDYLPGEMDEDGDEKPILPVSSYGGTNVAEAFAEVFSYYVTGQSMSQDQRVSFRWMAGLR